MPDEFELSREFPPGVSMLEALVGDMPTSKKTSLLEQLGRQAAKALTRLERVNDRLAEIYLKAALSDVDPREIEQAADILVEQERASAEQLVPGIERLQRKLAADRESLGPELAEALQASIGIAGRWLAAYRNTYEALLKVAAERRGTPPEILHARPVKGEIDDAALSREFMTRFPRIRAALAK